MKDKDALNIKPGTTVILNDDRRLIVDDISVAVYEDNKTRLQSKRTQWIAAGYADEEHPFGVRVWLWPAQIKEVIG
jgi:hypothetical protein